MLTQKQHDLLVFIDGRLKKDGVSPSYDEMKDALGLASKSGIHRLITALEERGFIRRLPHRARALEVLKVPGQGERVAPSVSAPTATMTEPANDAFEVPFVGKIAAGNPILAMEDNSNMMAVPANMIGRGEHFALEVEGESMIEAGILDGDVVVIRKTNTARNGQIVVALVDREEATLKRLNKTSNGVELIAENRDFPTRTFGPDRVDVQGVLVGLVRKYH